MENPVKPRFTADFVGREKTAVYRGFCQPMLFELYLCHGINKHRGGVKGNFGELNYGEV